MQNLFSFCPSRSDDCALEGDVRGDASMNQYFTPAWLAEIAYDAHLSEMKRGMPPIWESSSGTGACLAAIPAEVEAFGSEIDPKLARISEKRTGRKVIVGDLRTVPLPDKLGAIFGNPPFDLDLVEALLARSAPRMDVGAKGVLILPAYFFQTSGTVVRLNREWTISQEFIPRDLFNRPQQMIKPLVIAIFTRDNQPQLIGFRGYRETNDIRKLPEESQKLFDGSFSGPRSVWREVLTKVLMELGGEAPLSACYKKIEGRRPTDNPWWKEQVRKVAQDTKYFRRTAPSVYALPIAA